MAPPIIAHPNWLLAKPQFATVTLSGGAWLPQLPLANLLHPRITKVARSVDLLLASTRIDIDLGVQRQILMIAIPASNVSVDGRIRIIVSRNADYSDPIADTGWVDYWPRIFPYGTLPYGHPSWYDGKLSPEEAEGYPMPFVNVLPAVDNARHVRIDFDDQDNEAGHLDVAAVFVAAGWQASSHVDVGKTFGWLPGDTIVEGPGGGRFPDRTKPPRRRLAMNWSLLPRDEALVWPFEMQRRLGISGQCFVVFDPDDVEHLHRRSFLATPAEPEPLETVTGLHDAATIVLEEVIQ